MFPYESNYRLLQEELSPQNDIRDIHGDLNNMEVGWTYFVLAQHTMLELPMHVILNFLFFFCSYSQLSNVWSNKYQNILSCIDTWDEVILLFPQAFRVNYLEHLIIQYICDQLGACRQLSNQVRHTETEPHQLKRRRRGG